MMHCQGSKLACHESCVGCAWSRRLGLTRFHALQSEKQHHVHGIVNALYCPLACGAAVEVLPKFSPAHVWQRLMVWSWALWAASIT